MVCPDKKYDPHTANVKTALQQIGGHVQSEDEVGATISKELWENAMWAVILAAGLIVLYFQRGLQSAAWPRVPIRGVRHPGDVP